MTDTDTDLDRNGAVVSEEKIADCVDGVSAPTIAVELLREKHKKNTENAFLTTLQLLAPVTIQIWPKAGALQLTVQK